MVSIVPGGAQRSTAARVARLIADPFLAVPGWPMNLSIPAVLHLCPGVCPWIAIGCGGPPWTGCADVSVVQAESGSASKKRSLCIDPLLLGDAIHLELAILDAKREPSFDEIERVLAELLKAP